MAILKMIFECVFTSILKRTEQANGTKDLYAVRMQYLTHKKNLRNKTRKKN